MKNNMNKKASESLVTNKLIILILVVLVVATVLVFAFRSDTLNWIKNLPGFAEPVDKEIDLTQLTPEQIVNSGYNCQADDDVKVGIIGAVQTGNAAYKMFYDVRYLYMFDLVSQKTLERIGLQVDVSNTEKQKIEVTEGLNIEVGNVFPLARRIVLNKDIVNNFESVDSKKVLTYVSEAQLRRLHLSYIVGGSLICKKKIDIANENNKDLSSFLGYELVKEGDRKWILENRLKTKFYIQNNYIRIDESGWDSAIFSIDSSGKIFYTQYGIEHIDKLTAEGYGLLIEDFRKSKITNDKITFDEEMNNWNIIGNIIYKSQSNTLGKQFYIDLTNLYYLAPEDVNYNSNGRLMLSSAWKIDDITPLTIVPADGGSSKVFNGEAGLINLALDSGKLVLSSAIDTQEEYDEVKKTYKDLPAFSVLEELNGANFEFGKLVVYKNKPIEPVAVVNQ